MIDSAGLIIGPESLLAIQNPKPNKDPLNEENVDLRNSVSDSKNGVEIKEFKEFKKLFSSETTDEYALLQLRTIRLTIFITIFLVLILVFFASLKFALSLLIGSFSGILYLRLLARGIGKLGKSSNSVSKTQLVVPILLFFISTRFSQIDLLTALLGFLVFKPALIIQFLLKK